MLASLNDKHGSVETGDTVPQLNCVDVWKLPDSLKPFCSVPLFWLAQWILFFVSAQFQKGLHELCSVNAFWWERIDNKCVLKMKCVCVCVCASVWFHAQTCCLYEMCVCVCVRARVISCSNMLSLRLADDIFSTFLPFQTFHLENEQAHLRPQSAGRSRAQEQQVGRKLTPSATWGALLHPLQLQFVPSFGPPTMIRVMTGVHHAPWPLWQENVILKDVILESSCWRT